MSNQYKLAECAMHETKLELAARLVKEVRHDVSFFKQNEAEKARHIEEDLQDLRSLLRSHYVEFEQKQPIDHAELHEFCLDWQMCVVETDEMLSRFRRLGWDFEQFEAAAKKYHYWMPSMQALRE